MYHRPSGPACLSSLTRVSPWLTISLSPFPHLSISMAQYLPVSLSSLEYLHGSLSHCLPFLSTLSPWLTVSLYPCLYGSCLAVSCLLISLSPWLTVSFPLPSFLFLVQNLPDSLAHCLSDSMFSCLSVSKAYFLLDPFSSQSPLTPYLTVSLSHYLIILLSP